MLEGVMVPHESPWGIVLVRVTVPPKPLRAVIVIVDETDEPVVVEGEVAAIVKSTKLKVAVVK